MGVAGGDGVRDGTQGLQPVDSGIAMEADADNVLQGVGWQVMAAGRRLSGKVIALAEKGTVK